MIRIDGMTQKQVVMLDKLWNMDTTDEVVAWLGTLNQEDFQMAVTLQEMLIESLLDQKAEDDVTMAQDMLRGIGVKC